jgi:hypothetical protein
MCQICVDTKGLNIALESVPQSVFHTFNMRSDVLYGTGEQIHETLFYLLCHNNISYLGELLGEGVLANLYKHKGGGKFSFGEMVSDKNYKLNVINLYNSGFTQSLFKIEGDNNNRTVSLKGGSMVEHFTSGMVSWVEQNTSPEFKDFQDNIARLTGGLQSTELPEYAFKEFAQRLVKYNEQLSNHPRFSPSTLTGNPKDLHEKIAKSKHFTDGRSKATTPNQIEKNLVKDKQLMWEGIRKACKFGTEYFTRNGVIHYLIDGIDMEWVVEKRLDHNTGKMPICTSEIRYIFRNWGVFSGRIKFYRKNVECTPPWYEDDLTVYNKAVRKGWVQYALKLFNKSGTTKFQELKIQLQELERDVSSVDYMRRSRESLTAFHSSGLSINVQA